MPRFFFDVLDGVDVLDPEGTALPDIEAAKEEAARLAAGLLRDEPGRFWKGHEWTVRVSDHTRLALFEITMLASYSSALYESTEVAGQPSAPNLKRGSQ